MCTCVRVCLCVCVRGFVCLCSRVFVSVRVSKGSGIVHTHPVAASLSIKSLCVCASALLVQIPLLRINLVSDDEGTERFDIRWKYS